MVDSYIANYERDRVHLRRAAPLQFHSLRTEVYGLSEEHYQHELSKPMRPIDALGLSGSIFFFSDDRSIICKSVGRKFEYTFLYENMLDAFCEYYRNAPNNLLTQITDVLYSFDHRIGSYLGLSPSHYMLMTNVLEGLDESKGCRKWDLKPQDFFEPSRDLIPDTIKSEQTKSGLADELDEHMVLDERRKEELMFLLKRDTEFLEKMETIDYSLLLGRYPVEMFHSEPDPSVVRDPLYLEGGKEDYVHGVRSADGKWVYKLCILDFLWNVNQLQSKVMKYAAMPLPEQTITTEPGRYRKEFLKYVYSWVLVRVTCANFRAVG